jgi:Xaa-Pro aminopeptidase
MARSGIDILYVTSPANLTYLTGYDSRWYRRSTPTGLAVRQDSGETIFFDDISHRGLVTNGNGRIAKAAFFSRFRDTESTNWIFRNTCEDVVDTLQANGWLRGIAAVEHWALGPGGIPLRFIEERMTAYGARTVDGSWIVDRVRLVKSPLEITVLEEAARVADAAIAAVQQQLRPGLTEIQVQGIAHFAMSQLNGEEPAIRSSLTSGPRTLCHHPTPSQRKLERGDLFVMDFCGSIHRYHANMARTFAVGNPDNRWLDLVKTAAVSFEKVVEGVHPGDPMERVVEIARKYLDSVDMTKYGWFVGGYDVGIAIPPDWVGHTYLNGRCFERANLEVGTVVNFENVLDVHEGWPGSFGVQNVDTLVMTEKGFRILSKVSRDIVIGCP